MQKCNVVEGFRIYKKSIIWNHGSLTDWGSQVIKNRPMGRYKVGAKITMNEDKYNVMKFIFFTFHLLLVFL